MGPESTSLSLQPVACTCACCGHGMQTHVYSCDAVAAQLRSTFSHTPRGLTAMLMPPPQPLTQCASLAPQPAEVRSQAGPHRKMPGGFCLPAAPGLLCALLAHVCPFHFSCVSFHVCVHMLPDALSQACLTGLRSLTTYTSATQPRLPSRFDQPAVRRRMRARPGWPQLCRLPDGLVVLRGAHRGLEA